MLVATPRDELASDWSRDGKYLHYTLVDPRTGSDLWYLKRNEDGSGWEPHPFLQTPFDQVAAKFSPDGEYVAFMSNESGRHEVYVRPFPGDGRGLTVSGTGGKHPRWSRDGKELFYVQNSTLLAVSVSRDPGFSVSSATRLFEHPSLTTGSGLPRYDVSSDGRRFIVVKPVVAASEPSIRVVPNWYEEFRAREQD